MECDTEKLVHLIEERPPIYNYNLREYHDRVALDRLWEEIAEEMDLSVLECKYKWQCLRSTFNREIREGRQNTASGLRRLKKKKWYLFDAMQFLTDFSGANRKLESDTEETPNETSLDDPEVDIPVILEESLNQPGEFICHFTPSRKNLSPVDKMEFDVEKLLHLIEDRPAIYNFTLKYHTDKEVIDMLWKEIAEEMNLSVNECKSKWICLRNSYNRAIRESRENTASGSRRSKRKKWYLFDAMQFLKDFSGVNRKWKNSTEETADETSLNDPEVDIPVILEESLNQPDEFICHFAPTRKSISPVNKMESYEERLLHLIKKRPSIYNYNLKDYNDREVTDLLWKEIAEEMDLSVDECKSKWKCLRSSYNRAIREGHGNTASGLRRSKRRKWYLFDDMQFLKDFSGGKKKLKNSTEETLDETSLNDPEVDIPIKLEESRNQSDGLTCQSAPTRKNLTSFDNVIDPMIQFLKGGTISSTEIESTTLTFFKSLVPDVDKLSESRKRTFKQSVMNLLYENLEEQENFA